MSQVYLRPTQISDLSFVMQAEQHPDNRRYVGQWSEQQHSEVLSDPDQRHYLITSQDRAVGFTMLAGFSSKHDTILLRRLVVCEKGRGYGRQALRLIKRLVFEEERKHRLWLDVFDYNQTALRLYKSEGFVEEGRLRESVKRDGRYETMIIMSILADEYRLQQQNSSLSDAGV
jgi:diamine N-acetyltransferase